LLAVPPFGDLLASNVVRVVATERPSRPLLCELRERGSDGTRWQYSLDQKTWTAMPVTLQAKTDVSGLTSGTTYAFRFRSVLKVGEATWSQVVVQLIQ